MSPQRKPKPVRTREVEITVPPRPKGLFDVTDEVVASVLNVSLYDLYRGLERCSIDRFSTILFGALHSNEKMREKARRLFGEIDLNMPLCPCRNGEASPFD